MNCNTKLLLFFFRSIFCHNYNNITYFVLSITGILVVVCSKEGVYNLVTNGTLIALQHNNMNEDDMALEVLDFNKEHLARVKPYFTEESYSHLQRQGYIELSVRSAVMFM